MPKTETEIKTPEVTTEETAIPVETPVKKTRKPREKVRTVEELENISPKKMSEKEKETMIEALREANSYLNSKIEQMQNSVEGAFERARMTEDKYAAMESYYKKALRYIDTQLDAFHTAVNQATKGGIQ